MGLKGCNHFEKKVWQFLRVCSYLLTHSNFTPRCESKKAENICSHKNFFRNVCNTVFERVGKWTQMPINPRMEKNKMCSNHGLHYYSTPKHWRTDTCHNMTEAWRAYTKRGWAQKATYCKVYMNYPQKIRRCLGLSGGKELRGNKEWLLGSRLLGGKKIF